MKRKRKQAAVELPQGREGPTASLPELCRAVRAVRSAYAESQELFARRVGLAGMTISRFERSKLVPADREVLLRLAEVAAVKALPEAELFQRAAQHAHIEADKKRPSIGHGAMPIYSLPQWRLMHIAAIAVLYYPETAAAMEQAASTTGPAAALVDQAIREYTNRSGLASGLGFHYGLSEILTMLAEQKALESFKEKGNQQ